MPRGLSGGSTLFLPEQDISYFTRSRLKSQIIVALGGRAAEETVFDEITTGASSDLERVTRLARDMVTRFGMSEKLGPMMFGQKEEMVFLGREIGEQRDYSEAVAEQIDEEVRAIVSWAYDEARRLLRENRSRLDVVARRLLEVETIDDREFLELMNAPSPTVWHHPPPADSMLPPDVPETDRGTDRKSPLGPNPSPA